MRLVRSAVLEVIDKDFVRTVRAKGAKEGRVIIAHVLKNAMLPIITALGSEFVRLIGGAVVLESVFSIAGVGSLMLNAVQTHDIPVIMGVLTFVAIFVGLCNFLVDLCYALIDPRVRQGYSSGKKLFPANQRR
jgi:peptide/nickel transport system permease protein